nr:MAG TPA: hypothetical protein [Crassvirales sp.]
MESAELKENGKRVRHCFPRKEVYHRWIHDGTYVYSNQNYIVSGKYDWLFAFRLNKNADRNTITYSWNSKLDYNAYCCVAVINRDTKTILVNTSFLKRSDELIGSIPDDYQVFLTEETITNPHILSTGELSEVIKIHAKYIIKVFVDRLLAELYGVLEGKRKVVHQDINSLFKYKKEHYIYQNWYKYADYSKIYDFVNKYKVKQYDWYNKPLDNVISIRDNFNWSKYTYYDVPFPSLKQIINGTVFTKKEKLKLEQSYFYGLYCRGYGISRKELETHWNDDYNKDKLKALFDKHNIAINLDNRSELIKWKDGIKLYAKVVENVTRNTLEANIRKSNDNYNKAVEQYNNQHYEERLKDWRDFSTSKCYNTYITYNRFVVDSFKRGVGSWVTDKLYPKIKFNNIQLRYRKNKNNPEYDIVETSNNASVTLDQAIMMYKLYKRITLNDNPQEGIMIKHEFNNRNIKVGLYNLRSIEFRQKQTDNHKLLDKWEYVVIIGCHHIWIDDFMSFVKYYNLEDKFGIN